MDNGLSVLSCVGGKIVTIPYGSTLGESKLSLVFPDACEQSLFYSWARSKSWLGEYLDCFGS